MKTIKGGLSYPGRMEPRDLPGREVRRTADQMTAQRMLAEASMAVLRVRPELASADKQHFFYLIAVLETLDWADGKRPSKIWGIPGKANRKSLVREHSAATQWQSGGDSDQRPVGAGVAVTINWLLGGEPEPVKFTPSARWAGAA
jgi:hypothetical protein